MDAKGFELLMQAKILGEGGGVAMDAEGFERLMAAKILGKGGGGKIKELEGVPPLTFTANGQPLLDYMISGNTEQTGTPTPESPIMPSGCGDASNLCDITPFTANANVGSQQRLLENVNLLAGTYTFSCKQNSNLTSAMRNCIYIKINETIKYENVADNYHLEAGIHSLTFTILSNATVALGYWTHSLDTNCEYSDFMLNAGETPLPYEPYGYKLPLTSAGQGVDIYLGEVETTRRIKKLVLTGEEDWHKSAVFIGSAFVYLRDIAPNAVPFSPIVCTHLGNNTRPYQYGNGRIDENSLNLWLLNESVTPTNFKSFLAAQYAAGTPVTVWYVLTEPETAVVNEPLMKIGDYIDTVSMEQAGVEIPTNKGSTTLDVDTTIKPSNVYIKYRS